MSGGTRQFGAGSSREPRDSHKARHPIAPAAQAAPASAPLAASKSPASPASHLELKISSDPANLRSVRTQIEDFARTAGLPSDACDALGLALNEALANIIRHGYGGASDRQIMLAADATAAQVRLTLRDWGGTFDPAKLPRKDCGDLTPGGLGLLCIRKLMDEVVFTPQPDGMLLTMVKRGKT